MHSTARRGAAILFVIFFSFFVLFPISQAQTQPQPQSSTQAPANSQAGQQPAPADDNQPMSEEEAVKEMQRQLEQQQKQQGQSSAAQPPQQPSQAAPQGAPIVAEPGTGDQGDMFVFKKQVEEVVLHATVVDAQQRLVPNLDRSAFSITENGVPQTITSFRREDVPVELGIVIDNSGSMQDKRDKVNEAVLNLIRASNRDDQVFVVNFGRNPYLDQDFTSDENLLQAALHQVSAKGSTALYDAVVASSTHLRSNAKLDKKVLLVITDGKDNMSRETLQEALRKVQQPNGPVVYAIGLVGVQSEGREALELLAEGSGGVAYFPQTLDDVNSITRTVAHDIRTQYRIAYKPTNQNARPEYKSVQVDARSPSYGKLTVRTRSGYYPADGQR
ncbi:MAG TPA: VWA domain-containing protein [Candidatus Binatia bacterium]|nr:VWA domain-containing protein [Candidatus Binatia bacterium]